ncbi:nucleotidyltransferase family protein [Sulfitobacter sp.]|uniref:nucleotidyltransferase family protein n=1 Tax=Sulfitobacter sp. TaxID=1903071 RepID=UPI0032977232
MIAILLLAAGASRRMQGCDKLMESVDNMPLLRRQALRACAIGVPVIVTLPPEPHPRYEALKDLPLTIVPVPDANDGMNASISAGLKALPDGTQAVMIMLSDMPDITESDINKVIQNIDLKSEILIWRTTTTNGSAGHPIVFHAQLIPDLMALSGDHGGREVVRANISRTKLIPLPDDHARTDLDTPEAWANWRAGRGSI